MRHLMLCALLALALAGLPGCAQGPEHTRAAGAIMGTAVGAALGAAASAPRHKGEGAALGGVLGFLFGAAAAEDVAREQEAIAAGKAPPPVVYVPVGMPPPGWAVYVPAQPGVVVAAPPPGYVVYVLAR